MVILPAYRLEKVPGNDFQSIARFILDFRTNKPTGVFSTIDWAAFAAALTQESDDGPRRNLSNAESVP